MGYNPPDRSAIMPKMTPESEPEPEVKPSGQRQKTAKNTNRGSKKVTTEESLPPSTTPKLKTEAARTQETSTSTIQISTKDRISRRTKSDLANVDAINIQSSSPFLEAEPHGDRGSVARVLNTPELLEMILLNVCDHNDSVISSTAMKTLLLSKRVNKFFKVIIEGSTKLERTIWLLPDEEVSNSFAGTMQVRLNPLLRASLRHNRRPFAEASVGQHSEGAFIKILCTVDGFFGDGCESSKAMILAQTARRDYLCEVTFRMPDGSVPLHPDFAVMCTGAVTVRHLEDYIFQAMGKLVSGTHNQSFDAFLARPRWATALEEAKQLRATRDARGLRQ